MGSDFVIVISYIFGIMAIISLVISFHTNDKNSLFKYQIISSFSSFFQYLLIGSFMGALMNFVAGIRNIVFRKYDSKISLSVLLFFIVLITFFSMISFNGNISLLPMLSVLNYSYALWTLDLRLIRIIDVLASVLFIIYDICIFSVTGFILHFLEVSSALVSIYRFGLRSEKNV